MADFLTAGFHELVQFVDGIEPGYIYLTLVGVAFIENIFPPFPGDTFSIIAGYLTAVGNISLVPAFLVITCGTILSVMLIYGLGNRGGFRYIERKNFKWFTTDDLGRVQRLFARYGAGLILASRFVIGVRVAIAYAAGASKYPPAKMLLYSYISAALFHGLLLGLGFLMHAYIDWIVDGFNFYSKLILAIVAACLIMWFFIIVRRYRHDQKKA